MKVIISSTGPSIDDKTHELFGRCDFLIVFDTETGDLKAVKNENKSAESGAGIGCTQIVFDEGGQAVISGKVGPKAYEVLQHAKIDIFFASPDMTVRTALEKHEQGMLKKMGVRQF